MTVCVTSKHGELPCCKFLDAQYQKFVDALPIDMDAIRRYAEEGDNINIKLRQSARPQK